MSAALGANPAPLEALLWRLSCVAPLARPAQWLRRRFFLPSREEILAQLDLPALAKVREKHAPHSSDADLRATRAPIKYLDPHRQVHRNLRRIVELDLYGRPPLRILDLGCGSGYFLKICELLGHTATGLDLDESDIFRDLVAALGVRRVIGRIEPFTPLPVPAELGPFDLITAFAVCFNDHNGPTPWGIREWEFFFSEMHRRLLAPEGKAILKLNPRDHGPEAGTCLTPELAKALNARGVHVEGQWLRLTAEQFSASCHAGASVA